jgi:hypothetical protein
MRTTKVIAAAAFALLVAAACSTGGSYGDIFGTNANNRYDIRGTIDSIDTSSRSIWLTNASGYNTSLASGGGSAVRLYYDDRTTVMFQGRSYHPQDLERGDEVVVRAAQSGNQVIAESMDVTYNSHGSMTSSGNGTYGSSSGVSTIRGTVRSVDTYNRTITLDSPSWVSGFQSGNSGSVFTVQYDTSTRVDYNGQLYPVTNLERGDLVDVQVANSGGSGGFAQRILLVRDVHR